MVKFLLETENMNLIKEKLKNIEKDFSELIDELNIISISSEEFDFKGAINSIIGNVNICSTKIDTSIKNIDEIVNTHTNIQNSNKFELVNNSTVEINYVKKDNTNDNLVKYTVKKGDTLSHIALKYGVKVEDIAKANNIKNINVIITGTNLIIPSKSIQSNSNINETSKLKTLVNKDHDNNISLCNNTKLGYLSNDNFNVTDNNKKYNLTDNEFNVICAIVAAECDKTKDDALAVISVILNRCESSAWINSNGTSPYSQATAKNQFVVYQEGTYKKYLGNNCPENVKQAVKDAMNGIRNNDFLSFRSNSSTKYSNNQITRTGNRYK